MFLSTTSLSFKFVQTPEGMQNLFEVLQEFTTWCGVEIKVNFFFSLVVDKDRKRRENMLAPDLSINGERLARDLIKRNLLTLKFSAEFFAQIGIGDFQFLAALIKWSQCDLKDLEKVWIQAYTNKWHVPWSTARSLYTFSTAEGGH